MKRKVRQFTGLLQVLSTKTAQRKGDTPGSPEQKLLQVKQGKERVRPDRSKETELEKNGQLRSPVVGLFPGVGRLDRHHLHRRLAPVEAVIIRR